LFGLVVALSLVASPALGQGPQGSKSDEILSKLRQIDILNRLVPLLLTKAQLNKLLPVIEQARDKVRKTEETEYKVLVGMDADVTAVLDKAMANLDAPGFQVIKPFAATIRALADTRAAIVKDNEDAVYEALWSELDKGQKKAIAGTISPKEIDPKVKIEDVKDEELVRFLIRDTLLDPLAYPILVKLLKNAK
jgi:hypothetical protein